MGFCAPAVISAHAALEQSTAVGQHKAVHAEFPVGGAVAEVAAVGLAGLLQALHLDKAGHGQGVPVRERRSQVFRIAEVSFAVQADGQGHFRACLVRKMGVEEQPVLLENFRVGQKRRAMG